MAELTGKDTPATDPKSASKTGPVKPPVLEGTARQTSQAKPADSAPGEKTAPRPADKPAAKTATANDEPGSGYAWLAGLLGGVLGLGAAYGLAWLGFWPQPPSVPQTADPRLAQFATAIPELETVTATVQDELSTLNGRVATLENAEPPAAVTAPSAPDAAITEELAALSSRLDALTEQASGAGADSDALAALQADLASLREQVATTGAQVNAAEQQIATLAESADSDASAQATTVRLPLIFSGLEDAFGTGRPYETELAALRQALPDVLVPESVAGRAATGLPRPDLVQGQLTAALPDMLAGRPADSDAGWQAATVDWFRGLVAMRPAGAVEGDGPDAVVARLEAAVAARDFVAAQAEMVSLPETMRAGATAVAADVASLADAQAFLAQLRQQALAGGSST